MRLALAVFMVLAAGSVSTAPGRLTEAAVRDFVARQEAVWNARDAKAWAGFFTPDARFVDQARGSDNSIVPTGESTLAEATAQAKRFFAKATFHETAEVARIEIAPDGASARAFVNATIRIEATAGRPARTLCTESEHRLALVGGRVVSKGQTDTAVRCARLGRPLGR